MENLIENLDARNWFLRIYKKRRQINFSVSREKEEEKEEQLMEEKKRKKEDKKKKEATQKSIALSLSINCNLAILGHYLTYPDFFV
eukprot:g32763.t1